MNLIEIAEDLKDVPDQYLMQEIQQPTGNFPAYLVVSELSRRKRMRDKVAKEMPTQTVAEELATPPQIAQGMPQGLMGMPQAQTELAAQDVMGTTPPEMMMPTQQLAGGGMVSFKQGGDVPRFQNAGFVSDPMFGQSDFVDQGFTGRGLSEVMDLAQQSEKDKLMSRMTLPELQEFNRSGKLPERLRSSPTATPVAAPASRVDNPDLRNQSNEPPPPSGPTLTDQLSQVLSSQLPAPPAVRYTPAGLPSFASPEEISAARARKIAEFEQAVPDRATPFYQEDIARREKDIEGRRESNINEALIQAGLGIMGSKSPRFLGAVSEGGTAGLNALRQGRKDINQSEEALRAARAKMIESQTLRDQGKFAAGKEARAEANEDYNRALALYNTVDSQQYRQASLQSQNYGNRLNAAIQQQRLGLEALKFQREAALDPTRKALLEAQIKQVKASAEAALRVKPLDFADMIALRGLAERNLKNQNQPVTEESITAEVARLRGLSVPAPAATGMDYNQAIGGP